MLTFNSISIIFSSYNKQPAPAIITADTLYFQLQNCQIFFKISGNTEAMKSTNHAGFAKQDSPNLHLLGEPFVSTKSLLSSKQLARGI